MGGGSDTTADLDRIFHPRGVAVIGASNRDGNLGTFFLQGFSQMGFENLYVVHPSESEVGGINAYPTARDIPGDVDLAVVFSPRETVPQVVSECTLKGIRGVVICTSGFGEKDGEGLRLQQEVADIARRGGTRLIGPNCVGIYCPASGLANFAWVLPKEAGTVGMFSHSGSLSIMFAVAAGDQGVRFSKVISCGNECDLHAADFLEYLGQDDDTEIILSYLEGIKDGRRFFRLAREISKAKPIIVWKGGSSRVGARAAASHTGALAGSDRVWRAAFRQTGIISAESAEELLDYLQAFYFLPLPKGNRVAIVSGMGGLGVATADACTELGLEIAALSPHTRKRLEAVVPQVGTCLDNPVDLGMGSTFNAQLFIDTVEALGKDDSVDMVLMTTGSWKADYVSRVLEVVGGTGKPIIFITTPALKTVIEEPKPVRGIAVFSDGRRAAMALARMVQYQRYRSSG